MTCLPGDILPYVGLAQFGPAYEFMLEHDTHAQGSVDRILAQQMIRLCAETAPFLYEAYTPTVVPYPQGTRPKLEAIVASIVCGANGIEDKITAIAAYTGALAQRAPEDLDEMVFGGTEEAIIDRGSDWCTDVARVACVLCQVVEIPTRIVHLFNLYAAYSGHVIIEVFRHGKWGAVDSSTGIVYRRAWGEPVTTWELMCNPNLIAEEAGFYSEPAQFSAAAIVNYSYADRPRYDYTTSGINDTYRSILTMADRGWPGGLRWLHGEE